MKNTRSNNQDCSRWKCALLGLAIFVVSCGASYERHVAPSPRIATSMVESRLGWPATIYVFDKDRDNSISLGRQVRPLHLAYGMAAVMTNLAVSLLLSVVIFRAISLIGIRKRRFTVRTMLIWITLLSVVFALLSRLHAESRTEDIGNLARKPDSSTFRNIERRNAHAGKGKA